VTVNKKLYTNTRDFKFDAVKILSKPFNIDLAENTDFVLYFGKSTWDTPGYEGFYAILESYDMVCFSFNILMDLPLDKITFNYLLETSVSVISDPQSINSLKEYVNSNKIKLLTSNQNIIDKIINTNIGYKEVLDKILMNDIPTKVTMKEYKDETNEQVVIEQIKIIEEIPKQGVRFKVVVPSYKSEKWIKKTLDSISSQTYKNYDVFIVDDNSPNPLQREIIKKHCEQYNNETNNWKFVFNKTRMGALYNIEMAIHNSGCNDEDVCVTIDGDDWLYNEDVFNLVNNVYMSGDVLLTYGQYISYPSMTKGHCKEYPERVLKARDFRKAEWLLSHLRTFKYKLFKNIKHSDLLDPRTGKHFKMGWDLALNFPMSEEAGGDRIRFIKDYTYVYNRDNPLNDDKVNLGLQASSNGVIRKMKKYDYIKF
jgi:hypothetical protein